MALPRFGVCPLEDEVLYFEMGASYTAWMRSGQALRILRACSYQPPLRNAENHPTFLWVEALEGFYLLRQHLLGTRPLPWYVLRQVVPDPEENHFFFGFQDLLGDFIQEQGLDVPCEPDSMPAGGLPGT
ncbi:MAG: hypothetical protein ACOX9B_05440 [Candidatus Xenobium sp.]|jgi:hypothetical protein|nr:hypothetical protein [Burkholderiales bacterium]